MGEESEGSASSESSELSSAEEEGEMSAIIHQMDQELAQTKVGKSFEKVKVNASSHGESTHSLTLLKQKGRGYISDCVVRYSCK